MKLSITWYILRINLIDKPYGAFVMWTSTLLKIDRIWGDFDTKKDIFICHKKSLVWTFYIMPSYEIRKTLTTFVSFYLTKCNPRGWMYFHMINFYRTHCTETNNTKIKQSIFNMAIKLFILQCHIVQLILKSWWYETMKYKYKATNFYTFSIHVNILLIRNQNDFQQEITQYLYVLVLASCVAFILH